MSRRTFWGSIALAPLLGVLLGLAFPPYDLWPLALLSLSALLTITWRLSWAQNLLVWWLTGASFYLFLIHWLRVVGADAWVIASLALALWWLVASIGVNLVKVLPWAPLWIGAVLTTMEIMKSRWPWDGFPWGQLAFPLSEGYLANYLPVLASLGLTFAGAVFAAGVSWALRPREMQPARARMPWFGVALAVVVIPLLIAPFNWSTNQLEDSTRPTIGVVVVQGNVPQIGMDFNARRRAILNNHLRATRLLADQEGRVLPESRRVDLVIWPENSTDISPFNDPSVYADISEVTDLVDSPILVGAVIDNPADPKQVLNTGILWQPGEGPTQIYVKQNPVLFGEFLPFRAVLERFIERFERVPRDFAKGDTPGVFNVDGKQVGDVICFEVGNDAVVRNTVRDGAETLIIQTNNATYNLMGQTEQQLQIGKMRAREFNRFVVVAALSGISAVIDNEGRVVETLGEYQAGTIAYDVPLLANQTLSARFGHTISLMFFAFGWLGVLIGAWVTWSNRR